MEVHDEHRIRIRIESDTPSLLRATAKLLSKYYEKSNSEAWVNHLSRCHDSKIQKGLPAMGQAEVGNRQDAQLFLAWNLFLRWDCVYEFVNGLHDTTDVGQSNILVDTIRVKMGCKDVRTDIHARALMWEFVYDEFKARAVSDGEHGHLTQRNMLLLIDCLVFGTLPHICKMSPWNRSWTCLRTEEIPYSLQTHVLKSGRTADGARSW